MIANTPRIARAHQLLIRTRAISMLRAATRSPIAIEDCANLARLSSRRLRRWRAGDRRSGWRAAIGGGRETGYQRLKRTGRGGAGWWSGRRPTEWWARVRVRG